MKGKMFYSGPTVPIKRCSKLHLSASSECHTAYFSTKYFALAQNDPKKTSVERWALHTFNEHHIRDVADVA